MGGKEREQGRDGQERKAKEEREEMRRKREEKKRGRRGQGKGKELNKNIGSKSLHRFVHRLLVPSVR